MWTLSYLQYEVISCQISWTVYLDILSIFPEGHKRKNLSSAAQELNLSQTNPMKRKYHFCFLKARGKQNSCSSLRLKGHRTKLPKSCNSIRSALHSTFILSSKHTEVHKRLVRTVGKNFSCLHSVYIGLSFFMYVNNTDQQEEQWLLLNVTFRDRATYSTQYF